MQWESERRVLEGPRVQGRYGDSDLELCYLAHSRRLIFSQKDPLPTKFTCLFCNHEEAVTVLLDKKGGVGQLDCSVCGQTFQCAINCEFVGRACLLIYILLVLTAVVYADLSAAVDVYGEWVDAAGKSSFFGLLWRCMLMLCAGLDMVAKEADSRQDGPEPTSRATRSRRTPEDDIDADDEE